MNEYHYIDLRDECRTGAKHNILPTLRRVIASICRPDRNVKKFYIGIASGVNWEMALSRRIDNYKLTIGVNEIISIYSSTSQKNCREIETKLTKIFEDNRRNINRVGGGGGRDSCGPIFYVYLAVRRWG
jgi:hypothetical protein